MNYWELLSYFETHDIFSYGETLTKKDGLSVPISGSEALVKAHAWLTLNEIKFSLMRDEDRSLATNDNLILSEAISFLKKRGNKVIVQIKPGSLTDGDIFEIASKLKNQGFKPRVYFKEGQIQIADISWTRMMREDIVKDVLKKLIKVQECAPGKDVVFDSQSMNLKVCMAGVN